VRKVCVKWEVMCKPSARMSEDTHTKKLVHLSGDLQSWMVRSFFGLIICIEQLPLPPSLTILKANEIAEQLLSTCNEQEIEHTKLLSN